MKKLLSVVLAGLLVGGCAAVRDDLDRNDYQYLRFDSIRRIGQQIVQERAVNPGDVVLLMPLQFQEELHHGHVYDDAMLAGLVRSGVKVVRMSEKEFFFSTLPVTKLSESSVLKADSPPLVAPINASVYGEEAELVRALEHLRKVGIQKVICYRWIFSNPRGSGASDAKYEYTLRYPADRAFVKVIDTANGQTLWANLLNAQR